jgi:hypothetical protein
MPPGLGLVTTSRFNSQGGPRTNNHETEEHRGRATGLEGTARAHEQSGTDSTAAIVTR